MQGPLAPAFFRVIALVIACAAVAPSTVAESPGEPDRAFTVGNEGRDAFAQPAPILNQRQHQQFMVGRSVFNRQWAAVVSLNGDWGLGPTFNADRCSACHANLGRGVLPSRVDQQLHSALVRVSIPGSDEHGGPRPHPHYGGQLQNRSLDGSSVDFAVVGEPVPPEAETYVDWIEHTVTFADGEVAALRRPALRIEKLAFGLLGEETRLSLRNAQPLIGMGLLDAVPEETILNLAERQQTLGFNGRANKVWDSIHSRMALGRYGWKAGQASLREQTAKAAIEDMGLSDEHSEYLASGRDWRTAPLWGLGLTATVGGDVSLLHDGRARTITEAVLWHGGEAEPARQTFLRMNKEDRRLLLRFLQSL